MSAEIPMLTRTCRFLRVPYADFNCLKLPPGTEHEADFALLADIFPTGWHGLVLSGFQSGESVAVFGAGPVGLMAAYSATLRGASQVYVVDSVPERLAAAKKIGCIPIDFTKGDAVDQIIKHHGGEMVDRAVDAVGYQASASDGKKEAPSAVLESCIRVTRPTGGLGIPGLYVPSDPGAPDSNSGKGLLLISFGKLFEKVSLSSQTLLSLQSFPSHLLVYTGKEHEGNTKFLAMGQCNNKLVVPSCISPWSKEATRAQRGRGFGGCPP